MLIEPVSSYLNFDEQEWESAPSCTKLQTLVARNRPMHLSSISGDSISDLCNVRHSKRFESRFDMFHIIFDYFLKKNYDWARLYLS